MKCPNCENRISSETAKVVDSRPIANCIRRRRVCGSCGYKFTTVESIATTVGQRGPKPALDAAGFAAEAALRIEKVERQAREIYENIVRVTRPEELAATGMLKGLSL